MYPYFDLAHAALCCLAVRDDLANGSTIIIIRIAVIIIHPIVILTMIILTRLATLLQKASSGPLVFNHAGHLCR